MTVTIRDVAKRAEVSPVTVSRVINNSDYVSQQTRTRVEAAIAELGYVPNMLGPSLRSKKTMTLAAIISDITNPFWTNVTRGIEDVAQANGYFVILCNTDESVEKQDQYVQMLLRRRIDGILFVPASSAAAPIELIHKQDIPVVVMDRSVPDVAVDSVSADTEEGAYQLAKHLFELGHRCIAVLAGPQNVSTSVDRVTGYFRALDEIGIQDCQTQVYWGNFTQESGTKMAAQALVETPKLTAFFTGNNFIALGALNHLHARGLQVPEDVALVTFGEIPSQYLDNPFLTTDISPDREMGRQAAQLLLDRIQGKIAGDPHAIVLQTEMVIRHSSGPAPRNSQ
jgi:LacI family transcriptional regulator